MYILKDETENGMTISSSNEEVKLSITDSELFAEAQSYGDISVARGDERFDNFVGKRYSDVCKNLVRVSTTKSNGELSYNADTKSFDTLGDAVSYFTTKNKPNSIQAIQNHKSYENQLLMKNLTAAFTTKNVEAMKKELKQHQEVFAALTRQINDVNTRDGDLTMLAQKRRGLTAKIDSLKARIK